MARLGTPENPEVIEPGANPRSRSSSARPVTASALLRLRTALRLTKTLIVVCAPAVLFDYALASLLHRAFHEQSALSLLLAVVLSPPALIATGLAVLAGPLLIGSLIFLTLGRPVSYDATSAFSRFRVQRR